MSESDVYQLLDHAADLPYGPERVALVEEAVRLADLSGSEDLSYQAHIELVDAANWSGLGDRSVVAFAWCLAYYDRKMASSDAHFDYDTLLWRFKWVLRALPNNPGISRAQIVQMEDQLESRLIDAGYNAHTINYLQCLNRLDFGDHEEAATYYTQWHLLPRDGLADCHACELDNEVTYHATLQKDAEAVRLAKLLISGELSGCTEVPHRTYATIIQPLMRLRRSDELEQTHREGIRKISGLPALARDVAEHLIYLVSIRNLPRAMQLIDRFLTKPAILANFNSLFKLQNSVAITLEAVADNSKRKRKLRLPSFLPCHRDDHTYDTTELAAWFRSSASELANQFDTRNGNSMHKAAMTETRELAGIE
ncbi:hypothetical protein [Adhaeretor mobilis]|uniref:Uncharacterized protein n=1 Tax=Adhaeretor mobilis TaxID=1930276 RepID=A0A517MT13_9BACT|nr:hypothetical protein [Adhaeretor mobilis]QDS97937.1 hypothetical protein HG15A2_12050 [Adhaeretor mobilis]